MYWMGQAPRKPNSGQATAGWNAGRNASQPQTNANRKLVMPAVPNSLTPIRRKAPEITPLSAKPNVMTAVVVSWMSARVSAAMPPTSRSQGRSTA